MAQSCKKSRRMGGGGASSHLPHREDGPEVTFKQSIEGELVGWLGVRWQWGLLASGQQMQSRGGCRQPGGSSGDRVSLVGGVGGQEEGWAPGARILRIPLGSLSSIEKGFGPLGFLSRERM